MKKKVGIDEVTGFKNILFKIDEVRDNALKNL